MQPLTPEQQQWVEKTLASLSLEQCVAQLLQPKIDNESSVDPLLKMMEKIPFGGLFVWNATREEHLERIGRLQNASRIPIVVAADLENGPGYVVAGMTQFPDTLAVGAANSEELAYAMGQASALGGRASGIHWTFAPVADVNLNPDNPIANTRSLGDNPERIGPLAAAIIRGMQEHGLAACAKHFPGDGIDDIDQHISTSVNSLPLETWKAVSARTFNVAFAAGVWSVMIGHIAFPAWDPEKDKRGAYRPATVSRRIVTGLLRKEMKFDGLIVTDDMNMGGVAGYMNRRDRIVASIHAGCDMFLFPLLPYTYEVLLAAVKSGELSEERVADAARRVLEFKARLNLHTGQLIGRTPAAGELDSFDQAARQIAEKALVCVRDVNGLLPLRLSPGARVLTVTATNDNLDLPDIDKELTSRGFRVQHIIADNYGCVDKFMGEVDAIFINFAFKANWGIGSPRSVGPHNRMFMNGFHMEHPCVIFTSFGSPYHLRQFSTLPNLINTHSGSPCSQRAAVAAWFGEIPITGKSPVGNLERNL
ncbi:MAG: glycoside hydrolase family 3 protein [Lentisphaerota bacterium]